MPIRLYEELIEFTTDLMVILDPSGRVLETNKAFLNMGFSLDEVTGQPLAALIHKEDHSRLTAAQEQLSRGSAAERIELRCLGKDQATVRCEFVLRPSRAGPYILMLGRNLDAWYQQCSCMCWEYQAMERLINERTRDLQLANAEMESFSFSISHDLRAPLRVIHGFAKAIAEDHMDDLGGAGRDYLRRILANCDQMSTLISYLLDLARMSRQELQHVAVDVGVMADTIVADLRAVQPERRVSFSHHGLMMVEGDRELLYTLLQNLLGNAWKYTAKRPWTDIVFSSQEVGGERVFSVSDNGVGYPVALQERLFLLFQRLHDPNEYEGLGIGLPAAQRIVQRHGGRIWSECVEGERTIFYFTLAPERKRSLAARLRQE